MQGDDLASQRLVQRCAMKTRLPHRTRRVVIEMGNTKAIEQCEEALADMPAADDADAQRARRAAEARGVQVQAGDDMFGDRARIAASGIAELDTGGAQSLRIDVIDASGGGADKAQVAAVNEFSVDLRHRTHQQHFGIAQGRRIKLAAVEQPQLTQRGEVLRD